MNALTSRLCRKPLLNAVTGSYSSLYARSFNPASPVASLLCHSGRQTSRLLSQGTKDESATTPDVKKMTPLADVQGVQTEGEKYVIIYTCKVCNHRSAQKISKQGYHHGSVLVRCPSCQNLHLIADNMGIFEEKGWNLNNLLKEKGENFNTIRTEDVLEFVKR